MILPIRDQICLTAHCKHFLEHNCAEQSLQKCQSCCSARTKRFLTALYDLLQGHTAAEQSLQECYKASAQQILDFQQQQQALDDQHRSTMDALTDANNKLHQCDMDLEAEQKCSSQDTTQETKKPVWGPSGVSSHAGRSGTSGGPACLLCSRESLALCSSVYTHARLSDWRFQGGGCLLAVNLLSRGLPVFGSGAYVRAQPEVK